MAIVREYRRAPALQLRAPMQRRAPQQPAGGGGGGGAVWDAVGSKHDATDRELVEGGEWRELVLANADGKMAAAIARHRRRCPATAAAIDAVAAAARMARDGVGEVTFSALSAGAHLKPHCGSTNARLTAHLPLLVPDGEVCSIRCGDEVRTYREGELIVFDDSFEHEVWHTGAAGSGVRVVLLLRFWHPDLEPSEYAGTLREMRATYRRHQRAATQPPL